MFSIEHQNILRSIVVKTPIDSFQFFTERVGVVYLNISALVGFKILRKHVTYVGNERGKHCLPYFK